MVLQFPLYLACCLPLVIPQGLCLLCFRVSPFLLFALALLSLLSVKVDREGLWDLTDKSHLLSCKGAVSPLITVCLFLSMCPLVF